MSAVARALLADLGPDDLRALAEALKPYLTPAGVVVDGWLDTKTAAA